MYDLINESSFPEDEEKAFTLLSSENNLGRVKDSAVRNLSIIILKRLFRDETGLPQELLNRLSAALGAISRLNPRIYEEVISTKLGSMLSEANDTLLKRTFLAFRLRKELWPKIEHSEKIRIEGLLNSMNQEDLAKYQITKLAEINIETRSFILQKIQNLKPADQTKLIANHPSALFKNLSISLFVDSLSFDSAEHRGTKLILPICKEFDDEDLKKHSTDRFKTPDPME